ncbi:MAG TPA: alpha/beta hydrolase [Casimicrobiaceae bacterium]|nr:alpha/beta hydrolase [Casimicrobiaceae bacterium]
MTSEEVERGYNNRAAVPDHPRYFAQYASLSRAARERYAPKLDLRYGPNPREVLDLFVPAGKPRGTYLYIHGGYWRALSKDDYSFVAGPMLDQGIAVAVVEYDLCPQVSISTIVDECRRAVTWVAGEGPKHGAPAPLVIGGSSAGGHLVAMMYAADWTAHGFDRAPIAGGVTLSGVHDLTPLVDFSYNADLRLDLEEARRMSPAAYPSRIGAPLVIACGDRETSEFIRQSRLMWDAWPANRRPADGPLLIPGGDHFSVQLDHADPQSALTRATLALF